MTDRGWHASPPEGHVAFIGGTRKGKGVSAVLPVCAHPGPVVIFAVKDEWASAIGLFRARESGGHSDLMMHFAPDGAPPPQGFRSVGWSPLSTTWERAQYVAQGMADAEATVRNREDPMWRRGAGASILAPLFFAGGLGGKTMEWARRCVKRQDITEPVKVLKASGAPGAKEAIEELQSIVLLPDKMAGSFWGTASTALAPYATREALEATARPPIDFQALCLGRPNEANPFLARKGEDPPLGCWPTLLVTGDETKQSLYAPLFMGLQADLREARYGIKGGTELLVGLDDLAAQAPDPQLPEFLSLAAGRKLPVLALYHHDGPFIERYGEAGAGMAGHFAEQVIFRGIQHPATLQRLSEQTGRQFIELTTHSHSRSGGSFLQGLTGAVPPSWQESSGTTHHEVPGLRPDEITKGNPAHPDLVRNFIAEGWGETYSLPYHRHPLMLRMALTTMRYFATRPDVVSLNLPEPPELGRDGGHALIAAARGGMELFDAYFSCRNGLAAAAEQGAHGGDHDDDDPPEPDDIDPSLVPA